MLITGLKGYRNLNGNSNDSLGVVNGSDYQISYVTGKINQGGSFSNSSKSSINLGDNEFGITDKFTVNCWIKASSFGVNDQIFAKWNITGLLDFFTFDNGGNINLGGTIYISGYKNISGGTNLSSGVWYMVTLTYDGSNMNLYLNANTDSAPVAASGNLTSNSANLYIGRYAEKDLYSFDGIIDEVGIWDRALTSSEITQLYNSGNGLTYPFTADTKSFFSFI